MGERLVVIGGTAAGLSAASKAKRCRPELEVTVFERSGFVSYGACGLPYFIGDMIHQPQELVSLTVEQLRDKRDIPTYIHHEVTRIDREHRQVEVLDLETGRAFCQPYDYLVIATGATPVVPDLPGVGARGVVFLRTVEDGIGIKAMLTKGIKRAVVIGGGFIGLETAEQLTQAGVKVELVEALPALLPILPEDYSRAVEQTLLHGGVSVHTGVCVREILTSDDAVAGVLLSDGSELLAELVLLSVGVKPNTALAEECGLKLGIRGAIETDDCQQTEDPHIFACGDCTCTRNILTGEPCYLPLGTTANKQGRIAGGNIGGEQDSFPGVLGSSVTKVFNLYIATTGLTCEQATKGGFDAVSSAIVKGDRASYYPGGGENHINLVFQRRGGRLLGAQAIGSSTVAGRMNLLVAAITAGMTVAELNRLDLVYSPSVAPVYDPLLIAAAQALKKVETI